MKSITLMLIVCFCCFSINAQNLQRVTLGNSGSSTQITNSENTYYVSQSVGQFSVTGTLINGKNTIRQGFQQPPISVEVISNSNSDLNALVFPNPVDTFITVQFLEELKLPINITMYDVAGKIIINTSKNPTNSFKLDMALYSSGIYLLNLSSGNRKFLARLIKK
ncbi:MAG: T9SS type A sorting domain-containing protein [Lutibacter sp.]|uniref:T9SS type A sorting domain-containing protein n=1 Tax=Lutibacter sp. TaxID=1925666 RepID=UPI00385EEC28